MRTELERGWFQWDTTRTALEDKVGPATTNRLGVVAKIRAGKEKLRFIHDLGRSGINQQVKFSERLV